MSRVAPDNVPSKGELRPSGGEEDRGSPLVRLHVLSGGEGGDEVVVEGRKTLIVGRDGGCDLVIDDDSVSRRHARLQVDAAMARVRVEDLGSANGTRVDAGPVAGDWLGLPIILELGEATRLRIGDPVSEVAADRDRSPVARRIGLVVGIVAMLGLLWSGRQPPSTEKGARSASVEPTPVVDLPAVPKLPAERLVAWGRAQARDARFTPGALGLAVRGLTRAAAIDRSAVDPKEIAELQSALAARLDGLRFDVVRAIHLRDWSAARRSATRLRLEAETVDPAVTGEAIRFLRRIGNRGRP